jgi:uncharacterized protein
LQQFRDFGANRFYSSPIDFHRHKKYFRTQNKANQGIPMKINDLNSETQTQLEAAVLKRLIAHLDAHKELQNIDLMNLAGFCRNCLSKWYVAAAEEHDIELDYEDARERIYGMPYNDWKEQHQKPASADKLKVFNEHKE